MINGVVGLSRVALRVGVADEETIAKRRDVCRNCEFATKNKYRLDHPSKGLTNISKCTMCKCFIMAKTQLKDEKCPKSLWAE